MAEDAHERRMWMMMALLALWLAVYGYSIMSLWNAGQMTGGASRFAAFLGWQGAAGILAFAVWGVGRGFPKRTGIRHISSAPLGLALAMALLVLGVGALT